MRTLCTLKICIQLNYLPFQIQPYGTIFFDRFPQIGGPPLGGIDNLQASDDQLFIAPAWSDINYSSPDISYTCEIQRTNYK